MTGIESKVKKYILFLRLQYYFKPWSHLTDTC